VRSSVVIGGVVALMLIGWSYTTATNYTRLFDYMGQARQSESRSLLYRDLAAAIPIDATVSAQSNIQPHLAHRLQAYAFPNPFQLAGFYNPSDAPFTPKVDYILYDTRLSNNFYAPAKAKLKLLADLQSRGLYQPVVELDGIVLLRRSDAALDESCFGMSWSAPQCRGT